MRKGSPRGSVLSGLIGRIEGILFQDGALFIAEGLRASSHQGKELTVEAGDGLKTGQERDVQNAALRARQKMTGLLNAEDAHILQRRLVKAVFELLQKTPLGKAAELREQGAVGPCRAVLLHSDQSRKQDRDRRPPDQQGGRSRKRRYSIAIRDWVSPRTFCG